MDALNDCQQKSDTCSGTPIDVLEQDIKGHLKLLEKLKSRDLTLSAPQVVQQKVVREKPYDWQADQPAPAAPIAPAPAAASESAESIAETISENMEKLVGADPKPETPPAAPASSQKQNTKSLRMDSATIKFTDLQFGKNYDPTTGK